MKAAGARDTLCPEGTAYDGWLPAGSVRVVSIKNGELTYEFAGSEVATFCEYSKRIWAIQIAAIELGKPYDFTFVSPERGVSLDEAVARRAQRMKEKRSKAALEEIAAKRAANDAAVRVERLTMALIAEPAASEIVSARICSEQRTIAFARAEVQREKRVSKATGVGAVNRRYVYELGQDIVSSEDEVATLRRIARNKSLRILPCRQPAVDGIADCLSDERCDDRYAPFASPIAYSIIAEGQTPALDLSAEEVIAAESEARRMVDAIKRP